MHEILHVFMKDSRHLRLPLAILQAWTAWFVYAGVTAPRISGMPVTLRTGAAFVVLQYAAPVFAILWCYLIAQVVHTDAPHGTRQFWLTRPHQRRRLFAAKGLFILAWITVPLGLAQAAIIALSGMPLTPYIVGLVWCQAAILTMVLAPLASVAAMTSTLAQVVLFLLPAVLLSLSAFSSYRGFAGFEWVRVMLGGILVGSIAAFILWVQFTRRETRLSRLIALAGLLVVVLVPFLVSWDAVFEIQRRVGPAEMPLVSISLAPPVFPPEEPAATRVSPRAFQLWFALDGPAADSTRCEAVQITVVGATGQRWALAARRTTTGWSENLRESCGTLLTLGDRAFEPLVDSPVTIEAVVYATVFDAPESMAIPADAPPLMVPGFGLCRADTRFAEFLGGERRRTLELRCETAMRGPRALMEVSTRDNRGSRFYPPWYAPLPADVRITPIERVWTQFTTDAPSVSVTTRPVLTHTKLTVTVPNVDLKGYQLTNGR